MKNLNIGDKTYKFYDLKDIPNQEKVRKLPNSIKVLLENVLRGNNGDVNHPDVQAIVNHFDGPYKAHEIAMQPARVLMQDFTGVPAVVDLASMRDAVSKKGGNVANVNPLIPVDLVIDHSVMVDEFGNADAFKQNVKLEYKRNRERYRFLKWGQSAFKNFRVVPPGTGICHQVNLEYLGKVVWSSETDNGERLAYPDTLVGTDSHTTMINGLAVLGWGVGGIEAEAAMLGQPISMLIPEVIGVNIRGKLREGMTATDLVLTVTEKLRKKGVVGKFVEFYGEGISSLTLADRATISNMAPEYGATCGFFPIDGEVLRYLKLTNRDQDQIDLVEHYAKAQWMWRDDHEMVFSDTVSVNLDEIQPSLAGPKRPQDRVLLSDMAKTAENIAGDTTRHAVHNENCDLAHHDVVIAAITSCTNTSNPSVLIAAGLVARRATQLGLKVKPWVKTSLAPGSQVVTDYLENSGLMKDLEALGFNLVGYGCTTCIGNSGPLPENIAVCIEEHDLTVSGVLSGNRNFEGRINPHVKANYLASPPLVIAFALAGTTNIDLTTTPLGEDKEGDPVYLKDIWPSNQEIDKMIADHVNADLFKRRYAEVFNGDAEWRELGSPESETYQWQPESTYVKNPPYFDGGEFRVDNVENARILGLFGDSITTDHISPAGSIKEKGPAGEYLQSNNIDVEDFNSFGSRRGNHEIMMRGTFANIRIQNEITPHITGGYTRFWPSNEEMPIYDAAMKYMETDTPLVVIGGKEYGTGSSRDWAAKGTRLLGVKAVIAESFERIHRSNLIGMGVLPLVFKNETRKSLNITGVEAINLKGFENGLSPQMDVEMEILYADGSRKTTTLTCRLNTDKEIAYFNNGGILNYVLEKLAG